MITIKGKEKAEVTFSLSLEQVGKNLEVRCVTTNVPRASDNYRSAAEGFEWNLGTFSENGGKLKFTPMSGLDTTLFVCREKNSI